jgi:hypothetical protein
VKRSLATIAIFCFFLSLLLAETTASSAIAIAVGDVLLNGTMIVRSSPVLKGDRIITGHNAAAILHANGVSLQLGPDSEIRYHGRKLDLLSGSAQVRGTEEVVSGPFVVSPKPGARFQVQRIEARLLISLIMGTIKVTRGKEEATLADKRNYVLYDNEPLPSVHGKRSAVKGVTLDAAGGAGVIISHWLTGRRNDGSHSPDAPGQPVSNRSPSGE